MKINNSSDEDRGGDKDKDKERENGRTAIDTATVALVSPRGDDTNEASNTLTVGDYSKDSGDERHKDGDNYADRVLLGEDKGFSRNHDTHGMHMSTSTSTSRWGARKGGGDREEVGLVCPQAHVYGCNADSDNRGNISPGGWEGGGEGGEAQCSVYHFFYRTDRDDRGGFPHLCTADVPMHSNLLVSSVVALLVNLTLSLGLITIGELSIETFDGNNSAASLFISGIHIGASLIAILVHSLYGRLSDIIGQEIYTWTWTWMVTWGNRGEPRQCSEYECM